MTPDCASIAVEEKRHSQGDAPRPLIDPSGWSPRRRSKSAVRERVSRERCGFLLFSFTVENPRDGMLWRRSYVVPFVWEWNLASTTYCKYSNAMTKKPTNFLTSMQDLRLQEACCPSSPCKQFRAGSGSHEQRIGGRESGPNERNRNAIPIKLGAQIVRKWVETSVDRVTARNARAATETEIESNLFLFVDLYSGYCSLRSAVRSVRHTYGHVLRGCNATLIYVSIDNDEKRQPDVLMDVIFHAQVVSSTLHVPLINAFVTHRTMEGVDLAIRIALRQAHRIMKLQRFLPRERVCVHVHASPPCETFSRMAVARPEDQRRRMSDGRPNSTPLGRVARLHDELASSTIALLHYYAGGPC